MFFKGIRRDVKNIISGIVSIAAHPINEPINSVTTAIFFGINFIPKHLVKNNIILVSAANCLYSLKHFYHYDESSIKALMKSTAIVAINVGSYYYGLSVDHRNLSHYVGLATSGLMICHNLGIQYELKAAAKKQAHRNNNNIIPRHVEPEEVSLSEIVNIAYSEAFETLCSPVKTHKRKWQDYNYSESIKHVVSPNFVEEQQNLAHAYKARQQNNEERTRLI